MKEIVSIVMSKKYIATIILVALLGIFISQDSYAKWAGFSGSSSGGGGGGGSVNCPNSVNWKYGNMDCQGGSWVYYQYVNEGVNDETNTFSFAPAAGLSNPDKIDGSCYKAGGFWHLGYDFRYDSSKWPWTSGSDGAYYYGTNGRNYSISNHSWAHISQSSSSNLTKYNNGSLSINYWDQNGTFSTTRRNNNYNPLPAGVHKLDHKIYPNPNNKKVYYKAVKYGTIDQVRVDFMNTRNGDASWPVWTTGEVPNSLFAFCSDGGENKEATYSGRIRTSGDSGNIAKNSYSITFMHDLRRTGGTKNYYPDNNWSVSASTGGTKQGVFNSKNDDWNKVAEDVVTGTISPGQTITVKETLRYKKKITKNNNSESATVDKSITVTRNQATASGKVDASVTTGGTTATNPSQTIYTSNGNYTVKFQHTLTRGRDGAGGTVKFSYSTSVSGRSNRGAINAGSARSGTSSAIREGGSSVVVSYNNQTINGTLYPDETHTICQTLTYQSVVNVKGNRNSTARRCVTIRRTKATCPINNSEYGVLNGNNVTKLTLYRRKASNISNDVTQSIINQGEINIWAMPTDMIRYRYDTCLGGQLRSDYYNGSRAPKSRYTFSGNNTSASGNNRYKYLFGNQLGNGTRSSYILNLGGHTSYSDSNYNKTYYSPSVNNNALACTSTSTGSYYQIPGSAYNCKSAIYVGRNSDAGSVISQRLTYPVAPNSSTRTLVGNVKIPYNYDLITTPLDSNPSNTPINAGTSINVGFKIDVTSRCNVQVQGNCNSANKTYKTDPKTTQYRIYYWTVRGNTTESELKRNIGTEIKDKDNNVIGYYLPNDPKRLGYGIAKEGTDLFAESNDTATVSGANINIPANAEIGTKICTAVAVWPADSHDLPGANVINDSNQSVALKDASNLRQWRSSNPSCYTIGKKPTIAIKGAGVYAQNGIETSTSKRAINNSGQKIYGSWSEYTAISAKSIIGFSTGAGLWGGKSLSGSGGLTCRFSAMTLANENCSTGTVAEALGNVVLTDSTSSSPKNIAAQMKTRYTKNGTTGLVTGTNVLKVSEFINNSCTYDADSDTFKKQGASGDTYECLANGAAYVYSAGTLTINPDFFSSSAYAATNSWRISATDSNHTSTYVIHARDIVINSNIIYGSSADRTAYGHDRTVFKIGDSLPQVILIAENSIQIGASAYNIDAWLIAPNIDTCSHDYNGAKFSNTGTPRISANTCNRQLKINGPVLTRNLALNRTHGSGGSSVIINKNNSGFSAQSHGNTSAEAMASPAEIFNISPDVYIWAAGQSTRLSQAITTYQRELPARY